MNTISIILQRQWRAHLRSMLRKWPGPGLHQGRVQSPCMLVLLYIYIERERERPQNKCIHCKQVLEYSGVECPPVRPHHKCIPGNQTPEFQDARPSQGVHRQATAQMYTWQPDARVSQSVLGCPSQATPQNHKTLSSNQTP
mgnify:CR=1 FL=1